MAVLQTTTGSQENIRAQLVTVGRPSGTLQGSHIAAGDYQLNVFIDSAGPANRPRYKRNTM